MYYTDTKLFAHAVQPMSLYSGFHPVGEVGGSFPTKTPSFPPPPKGDEKREGERERREREGGEGEVCMFLVLQ